jgi:hypothetical protein
MDAIEGGIISSRKVSKHWNIPFTSLSNHLYGKTTFKKLGSSKEKDQVVVWVLTKQEIGLLISLQQLKLKVAKLVQIKPTPFWGIIPRNALWY